MPVAAELAFASVATLGKKLRAKEFSSVALTEFFLQRLDTLGRRRVLALAGLLHVVAWCGFLSLHTLGIRSAGFVVVYGLASGSLFASFFTYASDITPISRRAEGISLFGIWGMLPNGLGPLLGEFLIHRLGFQIYFLVGAGFALLSLCLSQLLPETVRVGSKTAVGSAPTAALGPNRGLLFVLGTTFLFGAGVNSLLTFFAPFTQTRGGGAVGGFFMSYACTAVAVRVLTPRLPDRVRRGTGIPGQPAAGAAPARCRDRRSRPRVPFRRTRAAPRHPDPRPDGGRRDARAPTESAARSVCPRRIRHGRFDRPHPDGRRRCGPATALTGVQCRRTAR